MFFLLISFFLFAEVETKNVEKSLLEPIPELVKLNEVLEVKPIAEHVINVEAPNTCGNKGYLVEAKKSGLSCQSKYPGKDRYSIYVCDKAKTFCKQQNLDVVTESPEGLKAWILFYWNTFRNNDYWTSPSKVIKSPNEVVPGFIANQVESAFAKAKKENKNLLLLFTQKYCPPCRLVKETSLVSDEFKNFSKDFILLQLDGDMDSGDGFVKKHHLLYTPTFVFFNSDGQEIDRHIDFVSPEGFKQWWNDIKSKSPVSEIEGKYTSSQSADISFEERIRLYKWLIASYRLEEAKELYFKHEDSFKNTDELISLYWTKEKMSVEDKLKYITKLFSLKNLKCLDGNLDEGMQVLEEVSSMPELMEAEKAKVELSFKKLNNLLSQKVLDKPSDVGCYAKQFFAGLSYLEFVKKSLDLKRIDLESKKLVQTLEQFPILKGASPKSSIEIYKSYVLDQDQKAEAMNKLSAENTGDFSYDFLAAMHDLNDKEKPNYERALKFINKALERADGRIWEKATKMKIQILLKMKKFNEAESLINESLQKITLPRDDKPLIHRFVQGLRDFQREIKKNNNAS